VAFKFDIIDAVFLMEQFVKRNQQSDPFTISLGHLPGRVGHHAVELIIGKREQQLLAINPLLFQPGHDFVNPVDVRAVRVNLFEDICRHDLLQHFLVARGPEIDGRLHEVDDLVAALDMALFAQKMDEDVSAA
jgi:hypothetical protein